MSPNPNGKRFRSLLRRAGWLLLFVFLAVLVWQATLFVEDGYYKGARTVYLQMQSPHGITLRWQSEKPYAAVVRYGSAADALKQQKSEAKAGTVHEVRLSGLTPNTRYWYSVGDGKQVAYGGTTSAWFQTAPKVGAARPVRFWVQGDPGKALPTTLAGRDAMLEWVKKHPRPGLPYLDLWLTTGDNAYHYGKNSEFQKNLFAAYPKLLANIPYWPVFGNHDARRWAFFKIFTLPANGESGGVPSGTEHYYSMDYGRVHFVFLDSHKSDRSPNGPMLTWLKKDLAATKQPWLIALFHHPPYSKGSHDSDDSSDSGGRMNDMRENALPILENAGVDLVLNGHSHVYERSYLIDCDYTDSDETKPSVFVDKTAGTDVTYHKPPGLTPHAGTIYNVVGSSAHADEGPLDHPVMAVSKQKLGSLLVDVNGNTLTARFITPRRQVLDTYRIVKDLKAAPQRQCR